MNQAGVPSQIGPYPVERLLGRGGMGAVYLGRHPRLGYEVAIKVLLAGRAASDEQKRRFRREVEALSKLQHSNLVTVLEAGEEAGAPWFAMRRIEGTSLEERLDQGGPLPIEEVVELATQLQSVLAAAHEVGVLHRDLKPANVLAKTTGEFVLTDFGLAKDLEIVQSMRLSRTGLLQGTPGYWSPEQASGRGGDATPATDVYGLGAVLYAALTGEPPVDGESWIEILVATREKPPTPPRALRPEVPPWLERVVLRCMEKSPQDRYPSMQALGVVLRAGRAGRRRPRVQAAAPSRSLIGLSLLGLGGVALGVALLTTSGETPPADAGALTPPKHAAETEPVAEPPASDSPASDSPAADPPASDLPAHARWEQLQGLWRGGRFEEALGLARELSADSTRGLAARHLEARVLQKLGRLRKAWEARRALWRDDPRGVHGLSALAEISLQARDPQAALSWADDALRLAPGEPSARIARGRALTALGRLAEALATMEGLDDPEASICRIEVALTHSDAEGLQRLIEEARASTNDRDVQVVVRAGIIELQLGQLEAARETLNFALRARPQDPRALLVQGLISGELKDGAACRRYLRSAHESDPAEFEQALQELTYGETREQLKQAIGMPAYSQWRIQRPVPPAPDGFARIEKIVGGVSAPARNDLRRGLLAAAEGWAPWSEIEAHIERAIAAAPQDPALALEIARLMVGRARPDAAAALARARGLDAPPGEVELLRALFAIHVERLTDAGKILEALRDSPRHGPVAVAVAHWIRAELDDARSASEAVLRSDPDNLVALISSSFAQTYQDPPVAAGRARRAVELTGSLDALPLIALALAEWEQWRRARGSGRGRRGSPANTSERLAVIWHQQQACAISARAFPSLVFAHADLNAAAGGRRSRRPRPLRLATQLVVNALDLEPEHATGWMLAGVLEDTPARTRARWIRAKELDPTLTLPKALEELVYVRLGRGEETEALLDLVRR